jgi:solute carrier family 25 uncoupling protein 8/9
MAGTDSKAKPLPLAINMLCGGLAGSVAELATLPLDTAKVRLQIQGKQVKEQGIAPKYKHVIHCVSTIAKEEGLASLWKGYVPGVQRQLVFASIRIGLYEPVRNMLSHGNAEHLANPPLYKKIIAGLLTGAIGITVANPTDVVKIRFQAEGNLPPGVPRRYSSTYNAYSTIIKNEGVKGLWTGWSANVARNAVINASELASYDQIKSYLLRNRYMEDGRLTHLVCGFAAGFCALIIGSPVDVMKTRIMNAKKGTGEQYSSVVDCFVRTCKEGPKAFYSGFAANFLRLGSWNTVMFMTFEEFKRRAGEKYHG